MNLPATTQSRLPPHLANALLSWSGRLQAAMGEQLVGVAVYGGLAKGEFVPNRSDVNVVIVVRETTLAVLDGLAPFIAEGQRDWKLAAMVLKTQDLQQSTDVFPIKFQDLQRYHLMVCGEDVFADLQVSRDHLRLRCKQELQNLNLRLRQFYLQRADRPELLEATLARAVSSLLVNLSVLVELRSGRRTATKAEALQAARDLGLETQAAEQVQALKRGATQLAPAQLKALYAAFMTTVAEAVNLADQL